MKDFSQVYFNFNFKNTKIIYFSLDRWLGSLDISIRLAKSWLIAPALASSAVEVNRLANGNEETLNTIIGGVVSVMGTSQEAEYDIGVYNSELTVCRDDLNDMANKLKNKLSWNMCLYGTSGTGKSLYGRYLADKLGMPLLHRRASDILSKYYGEAEQNIARLFTQAKVEKKIILIDEIEGLVFDRSLAGKAHEVSLVNEILSQLDTHTLPFIATSNLMDLIDKAMLRRFTFKFKFEILTPAKRILAYNKILGLPAPKAELPKGLTPADFSNVKIKMNVLEISDEVTISRWLQEELEYKTFEKEQIGFFSKGREIALKTD